MMDMLRVSSSIVTREKKDQPITCSLILKNVEDIARRISLKDLWQSLLRS